MLRDLLSDRIHVAVKSAIAKGQLPAEADALPYIEKPRDEKFGDYATNVAMTLAKPARKAPAQAARRRSAKPRRGARCAARNGCCCGATHGSSRRL